MSWKGSGVIREQNVESAYHLTVLESRGGARGDAVQEEAYLAALETGVSRINHQAAVCAVGGDCGGGFGLVAVTYPGDEYRVGGHLMNSVYENKTGYEHHRLRRHWRWIRYLYRGGRLCRSGCRSIGGNGSWRRSRYGKSRKCEIEASLYDRNSTGLVCVSLARRDIAEEERDGMSCKRDIRRHGQGFVPSLSHDDWLRFVITHSGDYGVSVRHRFSVYGRAPKVDDAAGRRAALSEGPGRE